jgi:8-oxo-dGTP diphosphatase
MNRERAHVFVLRDGKMLALQQSGSRRWWECPGGDLEPGETPDAAAVRETLEETGLRIKKPQLLRIWGHSNASDDDVTAHAFVAAAPSGDVRLSGEHSAFAWMSVEEYAERYCGAQLAAAAPQYSDFLARMRENCELVRAWMQDPAR